MTMGRRGQTFETSSIQKCILHPLPPSVQCRGFGTSCHVFCLQIFLTCVFCYPYLRCFCVAAAICHIPMAKMKIYSTWSPDTCRISTMVYIAATRYFVVSFPLIAKPDCFSLLAHSPMLSFRFLHLLSYVIHLSPLSSLYSSPGGISTQKLN